MKKLTRKLFLSVAALAVCAATLVSTTFAWYVSNQTATATGVTGATAAIDGDGSVFISKDGETFLSSVSFTDADFQTGNKAGNAKGEFDPVTTTDGKAFTDVAGTAAEGKVLTVNLWLKSSKDLTVTPNLILKNTTTTLPTQTAYQDITKADITEGAVKAGSSFSVDAVQALRMAITAGATETTTTIYDVMSIAKSEKTDSGFTAYAIKGGVAEANLATGTFGEDATPLSGAHLYYAQVMGEAPAKTTPATATTSWANISLTANTATKLTFTFWLEGADISCYDSCAGQSFQFDFDFSLAA